VSYLFPWLVNEGLIGKGFGCFISSTSTGSNFPACFLWNPPTNNTTLLITSAVCFTNQSLPTRVDLSFSSTNIGGTTFPVVNKNTTGLSSNAVGTSNSVAAIPSNIIAVTYADTTITGQFLNASDALVVPPGNGLLGVSTVTASLVQITFQWAEL
jgi:hypothetical protein